MRESAEIIGYCVMLIGAFGCVCLFGALVCYALDWYLKKFKDFAYILKAMKFYKKSLERDTR